MFKKEGVEFLVHAHLAEDFEITLARSRASVGEVVIGLDQRCVALFF